MMIADPYVLLDVRDLQMHFPVSKGVIFQSKVGAIKAVDGVSFQIMRGETLGLVGESGCGKTTIGRCILQLLRPTGGEVRFRDENLTQLSSRAMRPLRKELQVIFQDPYGSLNPRMTVGTIVEEPLIIHKIGDRNERKNRVQELFEVVGLNPNMMDRYPYEFSGGQRQRIGIARALAVNPTFIVCDEPVSALDVSIQAQVINLLRSLQGALRPHLPLHRPRPVRREAHLRQGRGHVLGQDRRDITGRDELYQDPKHPYTRALLSAVPIPDPVVEASRERIILTGDVPSPIDPPKGCSFHPRCPFAMDVCREITPVLKQTTQGHSVACHLY